MQWAQATGGAVYIRVLEIGQEALARESILFSPTLVAAMPRHLASVAVVHEHAGGSGTGAPIKSEAHLLLLAMQPEP